MKKIVLTAFALLCISIVSCESEEDTIPQVPQGVIDESLDFFEGEVIDKKLEVEEGVEAWQVKIENSEGAIINFFWTLNGLALFKMEGENGPFEYDIWPGNSLINFSSAKTVAIAGVKNDTILTWELQEEDEFSDIWIYTFEFDASGSSQKVYIDALNGNILQID